MSEWELRLACLRLAAERQGARDPRGLIAIAEELLAWVTAAPLQKRKPAGGA